MANNNIKILKDELGVIKKGCKIIPDIYKQKFLAVLAELEDNNAHQNHSYPISNLHLVEGNKLSIFRGYVDKISGWRIHVMFDKSDHSIKLCDVLSGGEHDNVAKVIKTKKHRYK